MHNTKLNDMLGEKRLSTTQLRWLSMAMAFVALLLATLACTAGASQYRGFNLGNVAKYQCQTATPVDTATPTYPAYVKLYPYYTSINTGYYLFVLDNLSVIAQNVGNVYITITAYNYTTGTFTNIVSAFPLGYAGGAPGPTPSTFNYFAYAVYQQYGFLSVSITTDKGYNDYAIIWLGPSLSTYYGPQPCPSCVPSIVYPTVMPSPTPYTRDYDFFLNDWVVIKYDPQQPDPRLAAAGEDMKVGIRVMWENGGSTLPQLPDGIPAWQKNPKTGADQWIYVWKVEVYNTGVYQYDSFPFLQSYVSDFIPAGSDPFAVPQPPITGPDVWGPSGAALNEVMPSVYGDTYGNVLEPNNPDVIPANITPSYMRSRELGTCGCARGVPGIWPFCLRWTLLPPYRCLNYQLDGDAGLSSDPKAVSTLGATARGPYGIIRDRIIMAAYGPPNLKIFRIGFATDLTKRPTPGGPPGSMGLAPTGVPGQYIASWINHANPFLSCRRDDVQP